MADASRKLFGTDGVRGEAGTFLTAELATALGRAATASLEMARPQVLIVRDTRESGPMLESALAAGIAAAGGDALLAGVLPTPAAAILVRRLGLDLAAVVSASHNPYQDNGIKFFSAAGTKLPDEVEARIEALMEGDGPPPAAEPGRIEELNGGEDDYLRELAAAFPIDLSGRKVTARLRQRRHLPGRAADLRASSAPRSRRSGSSPTAATSTTASARPTSRRWPSGSPPPMPRSASPSTATATACSRSTPRARSTTATS